MPPQRSSSTATTNLPTHDYPVTQCISCGARSPRGRAVDRVRVLVDLLRPCWSPVAQDGPALTNWVLSHFPIALSIVAAGAATVSLIAHAHDARAPEGTSWLVSGSVALGLIALIVIEQSLVDA